MSERLAIDGGAPVRKSTLPYARQTIGDADIAAVEKALRSDWLTTGPMVRQFEREFAAAVGSQDAVALSSGTAALHACAFASDWGPGDEIIVSTMTFVASANCVVYQGARPVFADVVRETLLVDVADIERKITPRTRAILAVDYAGQPCDYSALRFITKSAGIGLVADGCHALGASWGDRPVGSLADLTAFSLHPVKHITAGEGGVVTTDSPSFAEAIRRFKNHGLSRDHRQRAREATWRYQMQSLGFNYRLTDFQSALASSQLKNLPGWVERRREIARKYRRSLEDLKEEVSCPEETPGALHSYHLFVIQLELEALSADRDAVFRALRAEGIGVNVHYLPVHLHEFYREQFDCGPGQCPVAETAAKRILTLPLFPTMTDTDVDDVVAALHKVIAAYKR